MIREKSVSELVRAIHDQQRVSGLTHDFYRYPARFSPEFARSAIQVFTEPGDLIVDPFVGGGTVLVEALSLGRRAFGSDISSLAQFISKAKYTPLSFEQSQQIRHWADQLIPYLNLNNPAVRPDEMEWQGYQKAIGSRTAWPIRKTMELVLDQLRDLPDVSQQWFVRCALLRTGQWALDNRRCIPSAELFRLRLIDNILQMLDGLRDLVVQSRDAFNTTGSETPILPICVQRSAIGLESEVSLRRIPHPALIITSPPYPGLHVLYHRWQVMGRKETSAPFWIADRKDGKGASFYTFGDRKTHSSGRYFADLEKCFRSIAQIMDEQTVVVQMVGFSNTTEQLGKYVSTLERVGLREVCYPEFSDSEDNRLWRRIPNRKWYNDLEGKQSTQREVVLFHRLAQ